MWQKSTSRLSSSKEAASRLKRIDKPHGKGAKRAARQGGAGHLATDASVRSDDVVIETASEICAHERVSLQCVFTFQIAGTNTRLIPAADRKFIVTLRSVGEESVLDGKYTLFSYVFRVAEQ
jgi:hypothetical protein